MEIWEGCSECGEFSDASKPCECRDRPRHGNKRKREEDEVIDARKARAMEQNEAISRRLNKNTIEIVGNNNENIIFSGNGTFDYKTQERKLFWIEKEKFCLIGLTTGHPLDRQGYNRGWAEDNIELLHDLVNKPDVTHQICSLWAGAIKAIKKDGKKGFEFLKKVNITEKTLVNGESLRWYLKALRLAYTVAGTGSPPCCLCKNCWRRSSHFLSL